MSDLPRFYCSDLTLGETVSLDDEEKRHAAVLRLSEGDQVHIANGKGKLFLATAVGVKKKQTFRIEHEVESQVAPPLRSHLAIAPTKNAARMEWLVEKATEIGVGAFHLLQCAHSERSHLKTERLERIARSAMKQSKNLWLPTFHETVDYSEFIKQNIGNARFVAHCRGGSKVGVDALQNLNGEVVLCIGPEGDFSEEEVAMAVAEGYQPLTLGEQRLRTETAALAGVVCLHLFAR